MPEVKLNSKGKPIVELGADIDLEANADVDDIKMKFRSSGGSKGY